MSKTARELLLFRVGLPKSDQTLPCFVLALSGGRRIADSLEIVCFEKGGTCRVKANPIGPSGVALIAVSEAWPNVGGR